MNMEKNGFLVVFCFEDVILTPRWQLNEDDFVYTEGIEYSYIDGIYEVVGYTE